MSLKAAKSQGNATVFPGEGKEGKRKEERIRFSLACLVPSGSSDDPGCVPCGTCSCCSDQRREAVGGFFTEQSFRVPVLNQ